MDNFRFKIEPNIPNTYDDSLSYYEAVSKMKTFLNKIADELQLTENNVEDLVNGKVSLSDFVTPGKLNFMGKWHGFDPIQTDPGIQNIVNKNIDRLVSYAEYVKDYETGAYDETAIQAAVNSMIGKTGRIVLERGKTYTFKHPVLIESTALVKLHDIIFDFNGAIIKADSTFQGVYRKDIGTNPNFLINALFVIEPTDFLSFTNMQQIVDVDFGVKNIQFENARINGNGVKNLDLVWLGYTGDFYMNKCILLNAKNGIHSLIDAGTKLENVNGVNVNCLLKINNNTGERGYNVNQSTYGSNYGIEGSALFLNDILCIGTNEEVDDLEENDAALYIYNLGEIRANNVTIFGTNRGIFAKCVRSSNRLYGGSWSTWNNVEIANTKKSAITIDGLQFTKFENVVIVYCCDHDYGSSNRYSVINASNCSHCEMNVKVDQGTEGGFYQGSIWDVSNNDNCDFVGSVQAVPKEDGYSMFKASALTVCSIRDSKLSVIPNKPHSYLYAVYITNSNNCVIHDNIAVGYADPFYINGVNVKEHHNLVQYNDTVTNKPVVSTLLNGYINYGGFVNAGYYKTSDNLIILRGVGKNGVAPGTVLNLPTGCRPSANIVRFVGSYQFTITSAGDVYYNGSDASFVPLDGITFLAEQ